MPISVETIRATMHALIEREMEARILVASDGAKSGNIDYNSLQMGVLLGIDGAISGVRAAWIAHAMGADPILTLSLYSNRYFPRPGNEGIPQACAEISAIVKEWQAQ